MTTRVLHVVVGCAFLLNGGVAAPGQSINHPQPGGVPLKPEQSALDGGEVARFTSALDEPSPRAGPSIQGRELRAVHGQVVDHLGQPIVDAQVAISEDIGFQNWPASYETFDKTDGLGRFLVYGDLFKDRIIVSRGAEERLDVSLAPGQTYLKFVWPAPSTLRLEVDFNLCPPGGKIVVSSFDYRAGMSALQHVREQPPLGVLTFDKMLPGTYRVSCLRRIQVGGFPIERRVEIAWFVIGEGAERTLRVGPQEGIPIAAQYPKLVPPNGDAPGFFVEIRTHKSRYVDAEATVDIAAIDEQGRFSARVWRPGQYVMRMHRVSPRSLDQQQSPGNLPYETLSFGKSRLTVPAAGLSPDISAAAKTEDAPSDTVRFVHQTLDSEMPASNISVSWSFSDGQVVQLVHHPDRAGVSAELLRILNDPQTPHEWTHVACQALGKMTDTDGVVEGLLALLDVRSPRYNPGSVVSALNEPKRSVPQVIDRLIVLTGEEKARTRYGAYYALGRIAGLQSEYRHLVVPTLIKGLTDPLARIRTGAAANLGWVQAVDAKERLASLLDDADQSVRLAAGQAIWKIDGDRGPLIRIATELLKHANLGFRIDAVNALTDVDTLPIDTIGALQANLGPEGRPPFRSTEEGQRTRLSQAARRLLEKQAAGQVEKE